MSCFAPLHNSEGAESNLLLQRNESSSSAAKTNSDELSLTQTDEFACVYTDKFKLLVSKETHINCLKHITDKNRKWSKFKLIHWFLFLYNKPCELLLVFLVQVLVKVLKDLFNFIQVFNFLTVVTVIIKALARQNIDLTTRLHRCIATQLFARPRFVFRH